jgi:hypothetical protein
MIKFNAFNTWFATPVVSTLLGKYQCSHLH